MTRTMPTAERTAPAAGGAAPRHGHPPRRDIQGLRAVAVGLVVLSRAGVPGVGGGCIGVDVFFVISGHLITSLLLRAAASATGTTAIDPTPWAQALAPLLAAPPDRLVGES
ncbi:acyltransferase family protein [Streptomyces violaceorubidus]